MIIKRRQASRFLLVVSLLLGTHTAWAKADTSTTQASTEPVIKVDVDAPLTDLAPKPIYQQTARDVVNALSHHYLHKAFNNELSAELLTRYLKVLDPSRLYFLQSDINDFQQYKTKLDDALSDGKLNAGYAIFNVYQQRVLEHARYVLSLLNNGLDRLDYTTDRTILIDRSKADWPKDTKAAKTLWREQLISSVINMRLDKVKDDEITHRLKRRYRNRIKRLHQSQPEDVLQIYLNALTDLYDPHTAYFTPERLDNFNIDMSHSLEGIGAVLQSSDGYTKIVRLVPGGPAADSGKLQPADRIIGVGQGEKGDIVNIIGWRLDEVVQLIRGEKGTKVRLRIMPASVSSEHNTQVITITRDKIKLEAQAATKDILKVKSHGEDFRIGVITLPAFYQDFDAFQRHDPNFTSSYRDVKKLVKELKKEDIDALVMDLRNNGGGSLFSAIRLVSLFVDGGPTVQIKGARGHVHVENDVYPGTLYSGPMAVLVNRYSASASEIFTGAMQDYGRALIVGGNTFGKGTVQTLLKLNHGDIKITEAKFYRVSGSSNQLRGIIPDISLPFIIDKKDIGESSLPNALPWDHIASANYTPMFNFGPYLDELIQAHQKRIADQPDFVYARKMFAHLQKNNDRETLSLNLKQRKATRKALESDVLAITNQRRVAKGKKPLDSLDDLNKTEDDKAAKAEDKKSKTTSEDAEKTDENKAEPDAYLEETGKILGDLVALMKAKQVAAVHYWD